jgi:transcriptional regulator with XRE-family HTH domain|tara:strand:- start:1732 stop:2631 length:900 start_codon:yes stop_codon:yes gene_type:complete
MADMNNKTSEGRIFAGYVEIRMREKRMSQGDLHRRSAVATTTIARVLNPADDYNPQPRTVRAILEALDGSVDEFNAHVDKIKAEVPAQDQARYAPETKTEPEEDAGLSFDPTTPFDLPETHDELITSVVTESPASEIIKKLPRHGIPPELVGWVRADEARFCRTGNNKVYLATLFVNFEEKLLMNDFNRKLGEDISDTAKCVPGIEVRLEQVWSSQKASIENVYDGFKMLTSRDALAWKLSKSLDALEYEGRCPHCRAGGIFRCECGGVTCMDEADSSVTCGRCKKHYPSVSKLLFGTD